MSLKRVNGNYYLSTSNGCMCLGHNPTLNVPSPTGFNWEKHFADIDQKKKRDHNGGGSVASCWFDSQNVRLYS